MDAGNGQAVVDRIGETAGKVWKTLVDGGPLSLTKLTQQVDAPRDTVMQAIGWLAREDKLTIREGRRGRLIQVR